MKKFSQFSTVLTVLVRSISVILKTVPARQGKENRAAQASRLIKARVRSLATSLSVPQSSASIVEPLRSRIQGSVRTVPQRGSTFGDDSFYYTERISSDVIATDGFFTYIYVDSTRRLSPERDREF